MPAFPEAQLAHVGYYVRDLDKMVAFYKRVFGLVVTDQGVSTRPGSPTMAFLSRNPDEHHQIALATGRGAEALSAAAAARAARVTRASPSRETWFG